LIIQNAFSGEIRGRRFFVGFKKEGNIPACLPGNAVRLPELTGQAGTGTYSGRSTGKCLDCDTKVEATATLQME